MSWDLQNNLFIQPDIFSWKHRNDDPIPNSCHSMHRRAQPKRHKCLAEHATLPHYHSILYSNSQSAYDKHDTEMLVSRPIVDIAVFIKHWTSEDEARKDAKLYGFVKTIPYAIDAEADVEEGRG
jgi:hypothetical protein